MFESIVSWFPFELNQPKQEYYFLSNKEPEYKTKFEILLGEVFLKYNREIRQQASLYLDSLVETDLISFSTRVFPRP